MKIGTAERVTIISSIKEESEQEIKKWEAKGYTIDCKLHRTIGIFKFNSFLCIMWKSKVISPIKFDEEFVKLVNKK